MKFELEINKFDVSDIITTSGEVIDCEIPGLPVSEGGNEPDYIPPGTV